VTVAYLGLGGNVGDVIGSMGGALQRLDRHDGIKVLKVSSIYRTPPWGLEDQAWFHNACASLQTELQPVELLEECQKIERVYKRVREIRWGPRTLDLDILLYGSETVDLPELSIPHPRMQERAFVLKPLDEISDEIFLDGKTPAQWLEALPEGDGIEQLPGEASWWRMTDSSSQQIR